MKQVLFILSCLFIQVLSHGAMTRPTPRDSNPNIRTFPCGNSATQTTAGPVKAIYYAGDIVDHQFSISADHSGSVDVKVNYVATLDFVSAVTIGTGLTWNGNGLKNFSLQLPADRTCTNCVVGWFWTPRTETTMYVSCADIAILSRANDVTLTLKLQRNVAITSTSLKNALIGTNSPGLSSFNLMIKSLVNESDTTMSASLVISDTVNMSSVAIVTALRSTLATPASLPASFVVTEVGNPSSSETGMPVSTDTNSGLGSAAAAGVAIITIFTVIVMATACYMHRRRQKRLGASALSPASSRGMLNSGRSTGGGSGTTETDAPEIDAPRAVSPMIKTIHHVDPKVSNMNHNKNKNNQHDQDDVTPGELPGNWTKAVSEDGVPYYYNHVTGVSQWEEPTA